MTTSELAQGQTGPLSGLRILDLTRILAGPYCTQLLGDLGAEVIKVERPGEGDDTRKWGPPYVKDENGADTGESAYYLSANRNKRSVAIDIARPKGAELVRRLVKHSDVLIENFKVGGLAKYGLGYSDLKPVNPALVYCSITGFGQTGPNADRAGYDLMAQGFGGIMSLTGEPDGEPMKVAVGIADVMCGMYACTAILSAIRHRDLTGTGQYIDIALVDTQIAWLINEGANYLTSGELPLRRGNQHPNIVPYQVFQVADGHVIVAVGNDPQFQRFCTLIDMPGLAQDPRYRTNQDRLRNREALVHSLSKRLVELKKDSLLTDLNKLGVPAGPINNLHEVFDSDQVQARQMKLRLPHSESATGSVELIGNPIKFSDTPVSYRHCPPTLGADTRDVITEILGQDEWEKALAADVIQ